jgi:hypothetical protein
MKNILLVFLFITFYHNAQELVLVKSESLDADSFVGTDSYKNKYFVKDMVLYKQGPDGKFSYNDFQLGNIKSVDIINPLKIIVFYEDTNTVLLLDNKLNLIEQIRFNNLPEFINIGTATNAGNSKLWIFNIDTQQLELYNYNTKIKTVVSQPFSGKLISQSSNFNYCFVLTENKIRTFNSYGSLLSELAVEGFEKIIQHNKNIIALRENSLFLITENQLNTGISSVNPIKLPVSENTIKDLYLTEDFLYIYDGNMLQTFSYKSSKQ